MISCRKSVDLEQKPFDDIIRKESSNCDSKAALKSIGLFFAEKAEASSDFKAFVYEKCFEQPYGDYYIRIKEIVEPLLEADLLDKSEAEFVNQQLDYYYCDAETDAILFIPHLEEVTSTYFNLPSPTFVVGAPKVSFDFEYDDYSQTTPNYSLVNNQLEEDTQNPVTEEMAWNWENDIWVFGSEELCSSDNMIKAPGDTISVFTDELPALIENAERFDGKKEWGGIVQVTNIGNLESWVRGKLELKYFVNKSDGGVLKDRGFGKWRRKNFKNQRWKDFGDLIGYWNLSNWGPMQLERWIEEDGGGTTTVNQSFSPGSGFPTVTITHTIKSNDFDCGTANVQFTDPSLPSINHTIYNLNSLNFTRMSEQ